MKHDEANQLARLVADKMYSLDYAAHMLGVEIVEVKPGFAKLTMRVRKDMLNGHGICHGGITFTLADTAFAYACNSGNHKTVALNCLINFSLPANEGDLLTATAREERDGKTGIYDVTVVNDANEVIAMFRGTSYRTSHKVIE